MKIRDELSDDIDRVGTITRSAFKTVEHSSQTEAAIVEALCDSGVLSISLVAEEDDLVVGHIAFSPITIDDNKCNWFGLGPVSVVPEMQKKWHWFCFNP
nr:N-acetyltransferase [Paremcibacter congregatus]